MIYLTSYLLTILILGALAYRDVKDYILPDVLNLALLLCFIALHITSGWRIISPDALITGFCLAGGSMLAIKFLTDKYYKADGLGLGDVKLVAVAGAGLGIHDVLLAVSIGALIGAIHGGLIAYSKKIPLSEVQVPAGLGFVLGILAVILLKF